MRYRLVRWLCCTFLFFLPLCIVNPAFPGQVRLPLPQELAPPLQQIRNLVWTGPENDPGAAMSIVVEDFNHDGFHDVAVTTDYNGDTYPWDEQGLSILLGDGTGNFTHFSRYTWRYWSPHTIFQTIVSGDFNDDDETDLAILNAPFSVDGMPTVIIMAGEGNGEFNEILPHFELQAKVRLMPTPAKRLAVGDFNEDDYQDIAVASCGEGENIINLEILYGDGTGSFTSVTFDGVNDLSTAVATGDFNEDGHADLLMAGGNESSYYSVFLSLEGNGLFTRTDVFIDSCSISSLTVGNLNDDDHIDAVLPGHGGDETVRLVFGIGDGTFSEPVILDHEMFEHAGSKGMEAAVGDVNNDLRPDLVFGCEGASTIEGVWAHGALFVFPGDGDGNFRGVQDGGYMVELPSVPEPNTEFTCYDIQLVDIEDDGDLDVVASTMHRSGVATFINRLWKKIPEIWIEPHPSLENYQDYSETAICITDAGGPSNLDPEAFFVAEDGTDISEGVAARALWTGSSHGRSIRGRFPGVHIPDGTHTLLLGIRDFDGNIGVGTYTFTD